MKSLTLISSFFLCVVVVLFTFSSNYASAHIHEDFLHCLSNHLSNCSTITELVYTPNNPSYSTLLNSSVMNFRFSSPSLPKPSVIITPFHVSQIKATLMCSKKHGLQIRTRSGGHDSDGLSYISDVPYVVIDLRNLRKVKVDVHDKTAWVQAGATIGEVYYNIAKKSPILGFPAGICYTVGVGGHFSGGGYGILMRKYGLGGDNVIDVRILLANGKIVDRKSMGGDLFWALRGGGAVSFGIVLAWKINLVDIPSTITIANVQMDYEQDSTKRLVHQWQTIADKFDKDLLLFVRLQTGNSTTPGITKPSLQASFAVVFLGGTDKLIPLVKKSFPDLGLARKDCVEMSWIQSILLFNGFPTNSSLDVLLNRTQSVMFSFKAKADYVKEPIPDDVVDKLAKSLYQEDLGTAVLQLFPYGGRMGEIPESETPFPHRSGNLYELTYLARWVEKGNASETENHLKWTRSSYSYMAPYVSKNPREAYLNYRDLDIGRNNYNGSTTYAQASIWGSKYYKDNFKRLVYVKTMVDPSNFFRNEQSIPAYSL
ncbi:cannabidiolic acid synthase-like [Humulus lupulus]|uniref:cannabidiolic acid synthase-like n=1 Tax=Humulus lupulus TaxID=3486 RepID=UPI002B40822E|nr:cannabidiolic acid synthase-like [Humulus lupulus]